MSLPKNQTPPAAFSLRWRFPAPCPFPEFLLSRSILPFAFKTCLLAFTLLCAAALHAAPATNAPAAVLTNAVAAPVTPLPTAAKAAPAVATNVVPAAVTNTIQPSSLPDLSTNSSAGPETAQQSLRPLDFERREKGASTNLAQPEIDSTLKDESASLTATNLVARLGTNSAAEIRGFQETVSLARKERQESNPDLAEKLLLGLLSSKAPDQFKRTALLELAFVAQAQGRVPKAQQIFSQFVRQYPEDPNLPEVLLRQGLLYRQMGATTLAISKFYGVMNTSLNLKLDRFDYYKRLVLQAQTEIAETYYLLGQFSDAADYLGRLVKQDNPDLNKEAVLFKLVRSLSNLDRPGEAEGKARQFLAAYPAGENAPEARFLLADSLRKLNRGREAMEEVVALLESQQSKSSRNPDTWAYWQRRTGNEIANQLYKDGEYLNALEIYLNLVKLDPAPSWRIPVWYQTALVYEKLRQPGKADDTYALILAQSKELSATNSSPGLASLLEMARWRKNYLSWQTGAEAFNEKTAVPLTAQLVSTNAP